MLQLLQYKKKCGELETMLNERARESDATRVELQNVQDQLTSRVEDAESKLRRAEHDHNLDLESALIKLDEEQQRLVAEGGPEFGRQAIKQKLLKIRQAQKEWKQLKASIWLVIDNTRNISWLAVNS